MKCSACKRVKEYVHCVVPSDFNLFMLSGAAQEKIKRWPSAAVLGNELVAWKAKLSVGAPELSKTGLFRNADAIKSFLLFYSKFDFLEPPELGKYGIPPAESNQYNPTGEFSADTAWLAAFMDRKMHRGGENRIKPLRQQLKDAIKVVADRRRQRGKRERVEP